MTAPIYSRAAQGDLQDIWAYVAQHNPEAADALEADIRAEAEHLAALPTLGHRRRDLTRHDLWFRTVRKNYLIVYRVGTQLEIVRILHGARDAVHELH
ncbi:type II toxin-antitoxin system RelE/ParE family toxin [Prosthecobacter vanneervenii]|uniref:Plasmid stabilization system protein ParE n=1 Tax=Prosthecobacter vanneervenii TaxID=48466 RepID=A0A7W8DKP0_9BACT|nr:type II toxin-antitoxin system RelE/ParE family toxin [Prosthecobacter vanneervenii]MBB5033332.1 plasmid stabilization system protein ParE [Prosthecobacter vanneervenii]